MIVTGIVTSTLSIHSLYHYSKLFFPIFPVSLLSSFPFFFLLHFLKMISPFAYPPFYTSFFVFFIYLIHSLHHLLLICPTHLVFSPSSLVCQGVYYSYPRLLPPHPHLVPGHLMRPWSYSKLYGAKTEQHETGGLGSGSPV